MRMERLRKKLEGTYDLDDVRDCHRLIKVLHRGFDSACRRADDAGTELRSLALDVVAGRRKQAKEKASRSLAERKASQKGLFEFLSVMANEVKRAKELSDGELCDEVLTGVWADLEMDGRDSAVLSEMVERFRRRSSMDFTDSSAGDAMEGQEGESGEREPAGYG